MSTQSSATVAIRAVVMLTCLIAIPLAAVWGTSVPDVVMSLLPGRRGGEAVLPNTGSTPTLQTPQLTGIMAGSNRSGEADAIDSAFPIAEQLGESQLDSWPAGIATRASYEEPVRQGGQPRDPYRMAQDDRVLAGGSGRLASTPDSGAVAGFAPPQRLVSEAPFPGDQSLGVSSGLGVDVGPATAMLEAGTMPRSEFGQIERRLRRLGATYYMLELGWGSQPDLYRFHCRMAIGGNSRLERQFDATGTDPTETMNEVLRQVERWRGVH